MAEPVNIAAVGAGGLILFVIQSNDGNRAEAEAAYKSGRMIAWTMCRQVPRYRVVVRAKPGKSVALNVRSIGRIIHDAPETPQ